MKGHKWSVLVLNSVLSFFMFPYKELRLLILVFWFVCVFTIRRLPFSPLRLGTRLTSLLCELGP